MNPLYIVLLYRIDMENTTINVVLKKNRIESTNIYTVTEFFVSICYILLHLGVQKNEYYTTPPK